MSVMNEEYTPLNPGDAECIRLFGVNKNNIKWDHLETAYVERKMTPEEIIEFMDNVYKNLKSETKDRLKMWEEKHGPRDQCLLPETLFEI